MAQFMNRVHVRMSAAIFLAVIALPAFAGHNKRLYSNPAVDPAQYDYAQVLDARPVTEIIRIPREQQVCQQQPVQRRVAGHNSAGATIFGTILGGVIGSQIGHGSGRTVATIAGATIGGAIAHDANDRKHPSQYYTTLEEQCYTETSWYNEERIIAWDVDWRYRGKTYHSRMDENPGDRIPVRVSVNPVRP